MNLQNAAIYPANIAYFGFSPLMANIACTHKCTLLLFC